MLRSWHIATLHMVLEKSAASSDSAVDLSGKAGRNVVPPNVETEKKPQFGVPFVDVFIFLLVLLSRLCANFCVECFAHGGATSHQPPRQSTIRAHCQSPSTLQSQAGCLIACSNDGDNADREKAARTARSVNFVNVCVHCLGQTALVALKCMHWRTTSRSCRLMSWCQRQR